MELCLAVHRRGWGRALLGGHKVKTVSAVATDVVEARRRLGIFWPLGVYKKIKGSMPAKKDITTQLVFGRKERGVLLDDSHGCPIGCIELFAKSESGTMVSAVLGSSDNMDVEDLVCVLVNSHEWARYIRMRFLAWRLS